MWYLYVLKCSDESFYTGITNDVVRRVAEHQAGRGARYTRMHLPVTLLAAWQYPDRGTATQAEAAFKRLRRSAKQARIEARRPFADAPFAFDVLDDPQPHPFCPPCSGPLEMHTLDAEGDPAAADNADDVRWFPPDALPEPIALAHAPQVLADSRKWVEVR